MFGVGNNGVGEFDSTLPVRPHDPHERAEYEFHEHDCVQGFEQAVCLRAFAGWPALYDLSPGSAFLTAVNKAPLPKDVAFTSIYSCTDEYIQPYQTSIIPGAKNIGLCKGFVGHFEFFYNPDIYNVMHAELVAPAPKDPPAGSGGSGAGGSGAGGSGGVGSAAGASGFGGAAGDGSGSNAAGAAGEIGLAGATGENPGGAGNGAAEIDEFNPDPGDGCSMSGPPRHSGGLWLSLGALGFAWQRRRNTAK